jgi:DNA-binding transcriptional ArsR family regulator
VRLVDLRGSSSAAPASVEVRVSEAAELLRLLGVLVSEVEGEYDVGADRIGLVRAAMPAELLARAVDLGGADDRAFFSLSNAAARLDAPGDVEQLLALLDDEPSLPWRLLLSLTVDDWDWDVEPADGRAIALGDPEAIARLRATAADPSRGAPPALRRLLDADPVEHGRAVAAIVRETRDAVWTHLGPEAMGAIGRDAEHRRAKLAAGDDTATVVLEATNGYALEDDTSVRRILIMPSFWLRPWLIVDQLHDLDTLVLSTPVADAFVALPPEVPPPSLLKLTKALADEGRLKLLRRMSTGPVSLGEATEQLGVAKATAHHHLSILRQAGLVVMRGGGRSTRYALRSDPAVAAHDALAAYVPNRAAPERAGEATTEVDHPASEASGDVTG